MYYNIFNKSKNKYIVKYPFLSCINYTEAKWIASVFNTKEDALFFLKNNSTRENINDDQFVVEESFNYINST